MSYITGLLTFILVIDSLFLIALILAQPSKKEAGMGSAFGGATDVLIGAGSGNVLTNITKWVAGIFLGLCLLLTIMANGTHPRDNGAGVAAELNKKAAGAPSFPMLPKQDAPAMPSTLTPNTAVPAAPTTTPTAPATTTPAAPANPAPATPEPKK